MPHLWIRQAVSWTVVPLEGEIFTFVTAPPYLQARTPRTGETALVRCLALGAGENGGAGWVVVGIAAAARINGSVMTGLKVLDDRDELHLPGAGRCYFSTERLAAVTAAPKSGRPLFCPRCKLEISPGSPAVECPVCSVWHHEVEKRPCWSYAPECAVCRSDTDLDRGFSWSPERLS